MRIIVNKKFKKLVDTLENIESLVVEELSNLKGINIDFNLKFDAIQIDLDFDSLIKDNEDIKDIANDNKVTPETVLIIAVNNVLNKNNG